MRVFAFRKRSMRFKPETAFKYKRLFFDILKLEILQKRETKLEELLKKSFVGWKEYTKEVLVLKKYIKESSAEDYDEELNKSTMQMEQERMLNILVPGYTKNNNYYSDNEMILEDNLTGDENNVNFMSETDEDQQR